MKNRDEIRCIDQGMASLWVYPADIGGVAYHIGRDIHLKYRCSSQYGIAGWDVCSVPVSLPGPPGCLHALIRPYAREPLSLCRIPLDPGHWGAHPARGFPPRQRGRSADYSNPAAKGHWKHSQQTVNPTAGEFLSKSNHWCGDVARCTEGEAAGVEHDPARAPGAQRRLSCG